MKLIIYKGFDSDFFSTVEYEPLLDLDIKTKKNVLLYTSKLKRQINAAVLNMDDNDIRWLTYEEYSYAHDQIDVAAKDYGVEIVVYKNNLLPDYYPIEFEVTEDLKIEIAKKLESDDCNEPSELCAAFLDIYNTLIDINGRLYGSFYNYELERIKEFKIVDFFPDSEPIGEIEGDPDYTVTFNDDVEAFLRDIAVIEANPDFSVIGIFRRSSEMSRRLEKTLQSYCAYHHIRLVNYHDKLHSDSYVMQALVDIAKNDIGIPNFTGFRNIKFYQDPDVSKKVIEISQSQIISDIIEQAENAYDPDNGVPSRDIFITAFTGAGKSVMFQVPAVYIAKKYGKLTIIIEPVKSLMQDQKEQLNNRGYYRVETFNSDLITQAEKEQVLARIKNGEVDLLYLSPETLLSYSMETIIGDREIGLIIVDEAHIVTTWGVGFRPDYWYLGAYINRLRHPVKVHKSYQPKIYHFPICAFTATAVNSGLDDSVSETIISLYMEDPIKYIGYIKRDNIKFDITIRERAKQPNEKYEQCKAADLDNRIDGWLANRKKTIVYFPYATYARDARMGVKSFSDVKHTQNARVALYTGRDVYELGREAFTAQKKETFEKFRKGQVLVMMATKAFGMGVDVDDIEYVYHYAATGNLSDYVQEIGRVARKSGMTGVAITDYYYNDIFFMQRLFGMSQIRQFQIRKVLEEIYAVYLSKKGARSFLISPEAFTYLFVGKGKTGQDAQEASINQLKTCLLMLEKDFNDKFNFKVMVSRPQSVFTKSFVVIEQSKLTRVLKSKYGKYFTFVESGRNREYNPFDGSLVSDMGDVYSVDLKAIWEDNYGNISFPQFKYWYFNMSSKSNDKVEIMPEINDALYPRQKVTIEAKGEDAKLADIRPKVLEDFAYIAEILNGRFQHKFFTTMEFAQSISPRFGMTKAKIIANSLFQLVDPQKICVKHRAGADTVGESEYTLSNGIFGELMKKAINKSPLMSRLVDNADSIYTQYMKLEDDGKDSIALKLLSIFDYISYEIIGGERPEIFIRLNDPNKVRQILTGKIKYSNAYVTKAKQKHERDVSILRHFFTGLNTDKERWDYIEDYFLGNDVLSRQEKAKPTLRQYVPMVSVLDREKSYTTSASGVSSWRELESMFEDSIHSTLNELTNAKIPLPEYLQTEFKRNTIVGDVIMSWPSKDTVVFSEPVSEQDEKACLEKGWHAHYILALNLDELRKEVG